jgi:hypothetical protein
MLSKFDELQESKVTYEEFVECVKNDFAVVEKSME